MNISIYFALEAGYNLQFAYIWPILQIEAGWNCNLNINIWYFDQFLGIFGILRTEAELTAISIQISYYLFHCCDFGGRNARVHRNFKSNDQYIQIHDIYSNFADLIRLKPQTQTKWAMLLHTEAGSLNAEYNRNIANQTGRFYAG